MKLIFNLGVINKTISVLFLSYYFFPILYYWDNSIIRIHDVLDSYNVFQVLVDSGMLWRNGKDLVIEQIMNGLPRDCFPSNFYFVNWLIYFFGATNGFFVNYILVHVIAFIGALLLLNSKRIFEDKYSFNWLIASSFSVLPMNVLAGISLAGIPLVFFAFINLNESKNMILAYCIIVFYCLYSSMIHAGVFVIFFIGIFFLFTLVKKKGKKSVLFGLLIFILGYGLIEINLLKSLLISKTYTSHRVEYFNELVLNIKGVIGVGFLNLLKGNYGSANYFGAPSIVLSIILIIFMFFTKNFDKKIILTLAIASLVAVFVSFLDWKELNYLYDNYKIFTAFNLRRFHFLLPVLIILILSFSVEYLISISKRFLIPITFFISIIIFSNLLLAKKYESNLGVDNRNVTFKQFFSRKLFAKVDSFINQPKNSYRIVNIGIEPTPSQCYGFYTLDSYQNNYPLTYKHEFRKIIGKELEKDDAIRKYFDDWGNRCYIPFQIHINNNGSKQIDQLDINTNQLKAMKCKFVFSASPIMNGTKIGLKYLNIFSDKDSHYFIYLYEVV